MDVRLSLIKHYILSANWFSLPGRWALPRPSFWFIRRLQKKTLRLFPVGDDTEIFLVQESSLVLSIQMSDLERGDCFFWFANRV